LSCAETAKIIRGELKKKFPGQKFSVRSDVYSMGASIDVRWENGVSLKAIEEVVKKYESSGFDGSIDLKYGKTHYLTKEGEIILGYSMGTQESAGYVPSFREPMPEGAREVHLGADFIFCERTITEELQDQIAREMAMLMNEEYKGLDSPCKIKERNTWRNIVYGFVRDKDLTVYNGLKQTYCTSGSFPDDFFVLKGGLE
jgi:hypothetical protein